MLPFVMGVALLPELWPTWRVRCSRWWFYAWYAGHLYVGVALRWAMAAGVAIVLALPAVADTVTLAETPPDGGRWELYTTYAAGADRAVFVLRLYDASSTLLAYRQMLVQGSAPTFTQQAGPAGANPTLDAAGAPDLDSGYRELVRLIHADPELVDAMTAIYPGMDAAAKDASPSEWSNALAAQLGIPQWTDASISAYSVWTVLVVGWGIGFVVSLVWWVSVSATAGAIKGSISGV
jgi:hypothetical protein